MKAIFGVCVAFLSMVALCAAHPLSTPYTVAESLQFGDVKIPDLVVVARLLNATLVIPEIQESSHWNGISSQYTSFSYLYNEDQFIAALKNDVIIVKSLPANLKEARRQKHSPTFMPTRSGILYFGYMLIASYAFFVLTGAIGFFAYFFFTRLIYSSVKID